MKPGLEQLLRALQAVRDAPKTEKPRRGEEFEALLAKLMEAQPNLSRRTIMIGLDNLRNKYVSAQQRPSTTPPRA
jgi:hypothetical protein